ncbi:reverse transcriptase domain-containing protein [Tanacetum coccineum]
MHSRLKCSIMGEIKFFLGLQIHQSPKGIFINQAKYALEIPKKHNMTICHSIGTPLATKPKLDVDLSGEPVDQSDYRSKIGVTHRDALILGKATFLEGYSSLEINFKPVIVKENKTALQCLQQRQRCGIICKLCQDIPGICPSFCKHKIQLLDDKKPVVQKQRRLNPNMQEVVKKEIVKLLDTGIIYPIADSPWVSPIHCVPKKGGITVVTNENDELVPTRTITGWRVCIDYRKLNEATAKDHFPLPFMDQMLERLAGNKYFCFLDGFSGYFQIPIDPNDQEKITFTCPFGTYAYRRMPFRLCNAPATFQRCMLAIFHDMIEESVEVFMDDFSVFGNSFNTCLNNLDKMLQHCKDAHLVLNWKKCHFMVKEGIVLGHKVSSAVLVLASIY